MRLRFVRKFNIVIIRTYSKLDSIDEETFSGFEVVTLFVCVWRTSLNIYECVLVFLLKYWLIWESENESGGFPTKGNRKPA